MAAVMASAAVAVVPVQHHGDALRARRQAGNGIDELGGEIAPAAVLEPWRDQEDKLVVVPKLQQFLGEGGLSAVGVGVDPVGEATGDEPSAGADEKLRPRVNLVRKYPWLANTLHTLRRQAEQIFDFAEMLARLGVADIDPTGPEGRLVHCLVEPGKLVPEMVADVAEEGHRGDTGGRRPQIHGDGIEVLAQCAKQEPKRLFPTILPQKAMRRSEQNVSVGPPKCQRYIPADPHAKSRQDPRSVSKT